MSWLKSNRDLIKSYALFIGFAVIVFSILMTSWGDNYCLKPMNNFTADCSALCLRIVGMEAHANGTLVQSTFGGVDIKEGCNGIYATILFLAGVVAFPTGLKNKLIGAVFGIVSIFIINIVRVMTLLYLSIHNPTLFHEAHQYIWQFAIILAGGLMWLIWYDKIVNRHVRTPDL